MKPGELKALMAPLVNCAAEEIAEVVVIIMSKDGTVGLSSTAACEAETVAILGLGVIRLAHGLHDPADAGPLGGAQ